MGESYFHCFVDCMYTCSGSRWFPLCQWLCYKVSFRSTAMSEKHLPKDDAKPFLLKGTVGHYIMQCMVWCVWCPGNCNYCVNFLLLFPLQKILCLSYLSQCSLRFCFLLESTLLWTSSCIYTHLWSITRFFPLLFPFSTVCLGFAA